MELDFVRAILEDYQKKGYFPSAVCQVFDHGQVLYTAALGEAGPDDWFDMASVSKILCTTMLLGLMDEGKLKPEDRVIELLSAAPLGPASRRRLQETTVFQLMTHTSGIVPWFPFYADGRPFYTVLERVLGDTEPEQGFAYSDLNFMLLGQIFSAVSGLSLREGLEQYVKGPLGLEHVSYGPVTPEHCIPSCYGNQIEKRMCRERGLSFSGWRPDGVAVQGSCNDGNAFYYWNGASGHAGIFADAASMTRLCQYYMNTDSPAVQEALGVNLNERGLGFDRSDVFPEGYGHSGFTGTSIWFSKTADIGAVILTNKYFRREGEPPGNSNEFRREVHRALLSWRRRAL